MQLTLLSFLFFIISWGFAREHVRTSFINSFIINEQKPTSIILCDLCWNENDKIHLVKEISKLGSKVSTSMKNLVKYQDHDLLFLLDLDCPRADQVIDIATTKKLFQRPYRWLVLSNSTNATEMEPLWNSPLLPDSELVLAESRDDLYLMTELHKPGLNHSMVHTPRGFYNGTFVDIRPRREQFWRRMDLMGHPLTMSNVIQDSNKTKYHLPREDALDLQNDLVPKVGWMNVKMAFLMLNATPRYIFSNRFGYKINGQWSGMINDLDTGRADIGTDCTVAYMERLSVVAYTDTLAPFRLRFILRQPPLSYVSNIFSLPFSTNLWKGTAVCAAISAFAICLAARWELRFGKRRYQMDGGLADAVFWTMSAVSQQGCDMQPSRVPGRIMESVVFTSLMALFAAYSANIMVLLQAPSRSIATLDQLASSKITVAACDVDLSHFVFGQYNDPVRNVIREKLQPHKRKPQFYSLNEGVERIRQGLFAFHYMEETLYRRIQETFQEHEKCDLVDIDFMNSFITYSPMKKDSPYIELLRVAFKRFIETGIYPGLIRRYYVRKPACTCKGGAFTSVGVAELTPLLALMGIGAAASVLVLGAEMAVYRLTQEMKKRPHGHVERR